MSKYRIGDVLIPSPVWGPAVSSQKFVVILRNSDTKGRLVVLDVRKEGILGCRGRCAEQEVDFFDRHYRMTPQRIKVYSSAECREALLTDGYYLYLSDGGVSMISMVSHPKNKAQPLMGEIYVNENPHTVTMGSYVVLKQYKERVLLQAIVGLEPEDTGKLLNVSHESFEKYYSFSKSVRPFDSARCKRALTKYGMYLYQTKDSLVRIFYYNYKGAVK